MHKLVEFLGAPKVKRWDVALHILRYLHGSLNQGILLRKHNDLRLNAFCDNGWAACLLTKHSLSGYFVLLGSSLVSWKTKKQHTVSRSSEEAEYRSLAIGS